MQVLVHTRTTLHASNVGGIVCRYGYSWRPTVPRPPAKNDIPTVRRDLHLVVVLNPGKKIIYHIIVPFAKRSEKLK